MACSTGNCNNPATACSASASEPIGTDSANALSCNAATIDAVANSESESTFNRVGTEILTLAGITDQLLSGSSVILPPVEYGSGSIVLTGVNPGAGLYATNQAVWFSGSTLRWAGLNSELPYDMSQPFDFTKWVAATVSILTDTQNPIVGPGDDTITPTGSPVVFAAELYVNGKHQDQDTFHIENNLDIVLDGWTFSGGEDVEIRLNVEATPGDDSGLREIDAARIGGSFKDDELENLSPSLNLSNVLAAFHEESNLSVNVSDLTGVVTSVPASFPDDGKIEVNSITKQLRRLTPAVENEIFVEAFEFGSNGDPRVIIQAAIDYIESKGKRTLLKFGKESYTLKSLYPSIDLPALMSGKKIGILIKDANLVWIDGNGCNILPDSSLPALAQMDDVVAIGDDATDQAFMNIKNIRVDGGVWGDINDEPAYNIRADYNVGKYSIFDNVVCRRSRESNIKLCGFVMHLSDCDMRFASNLSNYEIVTQAVDGSTGARTGYSFENCVSDYAGLYGYNITGTSGHTYCHFDNCTSDHIGRDRAGNTIVPNIGTAASYFTSGMFGCTQTNCGSEFSTRFARHQSPRGFRIEGCYSNGNGTTDGFTVTDAHIQMTGRVESCSITGYRFGNITLTTDILLLDESGITGNNNNITLDASIPDSLVNVINQVENTSQGTLISRIDDFYSSGFRNPTGDACLFGDPLPGTIGYPNGFNFNRRKIFKFSTAGGGAPVSHNLAELVDNARQGAATFEVRVSFGQSLAGVPANGAVLLATTSVNAGTFVITNFTAIIGSVPASVGISWSGNVLRITNSELFSYMDVEVVATARPEAGSMDFDWVNTTT